MARAQGHEDRVAEMTRRAEKLAEKRKASKEKKKAEKEPPKTSEDLDNEIDSYWAASNAATVEEDDTGADAAVAATAGETEVAAESVVAEAEETAATEE